jgi:hypothetical protein
MKQTPICRKHEKGNAILEFALVASFLVPLFAASIILGMTLSKGIQLNNLSREAAVLLVRTTTDPSAGLDLSKPSNQKILMRAAQGLRMNQSGTLTPDSAGNGAIILSKVILVSDVECAAGVTPIPANAPPWNAGNCPNYGKYVFAYRVVIGNGTKFSSVTGNPPSGIVQSDGSITAGNIAMNTANLASNFGTNGSQILTLQPSTFALVAETYADISYLNIFFSIMQTPILYTRNVS